MIAAFIGIAGGVIAALAGFLLGGRRGDAERSALLAQLSTLEGHAAVWQQAQALVAPFADDAHRKQVMRELQARDHRGELPALVEDIRQRGDFASVSLVDARGLVLAHAGLEGDGDLACRSASLLLNFMERSLAAGEPQPRSVVIHDDAQRAQLLRVVAEPGEHFVLSAFAEGRVPRTDELDPALPRIRALLRA